MSATNHTANIELPIFVGDDKPAWLTDWNGAMTTIDGAVGTAQTDISGITATVSTQGGQISSLTTTVGNHTTSISALTDATTHNAGDINTINSLIGNGTPTTTDQTIIGAINELHADQGDLDDLQTTDKSSLVAAINEAAQSVASGAMKQEVTTLTVTADGVKNYSALLTELCGLYKDHMTGRQAGEFSIAMTINVAGFFDNVVKQKKSGSDGNFSVHATKVSGGTSFDVLTCYGVTSGGSSIELTSFPISGSTPTDTDMSAQVPTSGEQIKLTVMDYLLA